MRLIREQLSGLDVSDPADVSARAAAVRELITSWPIPGRSRPTSGPATGELCERR